MTVSPKIAVVTGGNRGLGLEISRQLIARGVKVLLTSRDASKGKETAEMLGADFFPLDVSNEKSRKEFLQFALEELERVDILVNNAGVFSYAKALEVDLKEIRDVFEINTLGPLRLVQMLLPLLKKSKQARVINMSSGLGALGSMETGEFASYRISKTGLNVVTAMLAAELAETSISVNSMCPGWTRTAMGGPNATRSVEEGADTATWLALDAPSDLRGTFVRDRKVIAW